MSEGVKGRAWDSNRANFDRNFAVVIGINQYQNGIARLNTAKHDAEKLAELLEKNYQYQVELLTDDAARKPTLEELVTLLTQELPQKLQSPTKINRLIFYFAGHGMPLESDEGPRGFLLPQDANPNDSKTFLPMQVLHDALIALPCHHLLIILDCCFAGSFRWATTRKLIPLPETLHREHYDRFIRYPAWQVITSAAHDQEALDFLSDKRGISAKSQDQAVKHSPFAEALFEALQNGAPDAKGKLYKQADLTKDGVITASELYLYLRDSVETRSGERQTPGIYPLKKHDRGEYIFHDPDFNPSSLSEAPPLDQANNPYRGLKPFEERHARFFFGRQELIENLYKRITLPNHPLTVVLGVSGSGKSSLVKAGLIPFLRQDKTHTWQILPPMRPGESPFAALAITLLPIVDVISELPHSTQPESEQATSPDFLNTLNQQLQSNSSHFIELIQSWSQQHPDAHLLLLIDQFEELITLARNPQPENQADSPDNTQQFLNLLEIAIAADLPQLRIIVTLRSDFEPRFLNSDTLKSHWTQARFPVRAMRSDELRQAIEGPASEMALYFEPANLVDRLIDEVGQMPGALPLLSFTLSELYVKLTDKWRNQEPSDRALTIDTEFDKEGGVAGSLTRRANEEYDKLVKNADTNDKDQGGFGKEKGKAYQVAMRRIMLRMLTLEGGETARRRVPDSELIYPTPKESNRVKQVVDRLVNARLLVRGQLETGEPYVEPAHDFLVRGWGLLQDWINEEKAKETLELQQRLTAQANDWARNQGPLLPDGDRLNQLEKILVLTDNWLNHRETEFINSSIEYRDIQQKQAKELRAKAELRQKAAKVENMLSVKPLDGLVLAIQAMGQNLEELPQQILSPVQTSLQQAMESSRESNIFRLRENLCLVALSPDGKLIASCSSTRVCLWDLRGNLITQLLQPHGDYISSSSPAFSPDGKLVAGSGLHNTIWLWDLGGNLVRAFQGHEITNDHNSIDAVAFSPDGQTIVSGGSDGTIRLWDLSGTPIGKPFYGHQYPVSSVAFSADGQTIASGGNDKTVRLWDLNGNPIGKPFYGHEMLVYSVIFSLDGKTIISSSADKTIRLWDRNGAVIEQSFMGHEKGVRAAALSPDGKTIVSGSNDRTIRLWDWSGKLIGQPLRGHENSVNTVTFSPDGGMIISSDDDGTIILWELSSTLIGKPFQGHENWILSVAFSPNGKTIASGGDKTIRLWDLHGNQIEQPFQGHEHLVNTVAFSPDGKIIASGGKDKTIRFWDLHGNPTGQASQGDEHFVDPIPFSPSGNTVNAIAFSPDGKTIVSGGQDGTIRLWNVSGEPIGQPFQGHTDWVSSISFSRDGKLIVSGSYDGTLRLWNLSGNLIGQPLRGHENAVVSVAFSPDGKVIVSGGQDMTIRLWDLQGNPIGEPFRGHEYALSSVTFSPDGMTIVSGSGDSTLRLWDLQGNPIGEPFQGHEQAVSSVAFSQNGKFIVSGSIDKTLHLWRGGWRGWLEVCCDRLRYHPVFTNPESIEDLEQREIAIAAWKTCEKYVWGKADSAIE